MATALLLHVWAILLPFALVVGEAVEVVRTRRVRWRIVGALLAAAPALAIHPILLRASKTVIFGGAAYEPTLDKLYTAFRSDVPRPRVIAAMLVAVALVGWWSRRRGSEPVHGVSGLDASELAVIVALLMSPLVPFVYAELNTGAFMTRYALFALPATVSLIGAVLFAVGGGRPLAGQSAALVALVGVWLYLPPKIRDRRQSERGAREPVCIVRLSRCVGTARAGQPRRRAGVRRPGVRRRPRARGLRR